MMPLGDYPPGGGGRHLSMLAGAGVGGAVAGLTERQTPSVLITLPEHTAYLSSARSHRRAERISWARANLEDAARDLLLAEAAALGVTTAATPWAHNRERIRPLIESARKDMV
jgi:hypothetical protein